MSDWFEEKELTPVQVQEFEAMCEDMYSRKASIDEIKDILKTQEDILNKMKLKIMAYMEDFGKTKYVTNRGTVYISEKFSVKVPKDPEKKAEFYAWLDSKGIKDALTTVHSATLNALYNEELKASGDPQFSIPGIDEPTSYKQLQMRSK